MFYDIGKKIMSWVKAVCIIGWICVLVNMIGQWGIIGDSGWQYLETKYGTDSKFTCVLTEFLTAVLTAGGIYVGSFVLYGFGQLVDDVHEMRGKQAPVVVLKEETMEGRKKEDPKTGYTPASSPVVYNGPIWVCKACGASNPVHRGSCKKCGTYK